MFQDLIATESVHISIAATNKHPRREGMEPMEEAMIMMIGKNGKDLSNSKYHFTFWKGQSYWRPSSNVGGRVPLSILD